MRVAGINIPDNKRLEIGLTALYGVGRATASRILKQAGIHSAKKPSQIVQEDENKIRKIMDGLKLEGELKREISSNIKRLKDIKCYRGVRHLRTLPVRGQRTKTNSRTRRGNVRKTMGSGKKKVEKK